jgi:hypothetical protein
VCHSIGENRKTEFFGYSDLPAINVDDRENTITDRRDIAQSRACVGALTAKKDEPDGSRPVTLNWNFSVARDADVYEVTFRG